MAGRERGNLWAVVLAGGEGRRLAPLTRALYGDDLPKQFAVLAGDRSLLQTTLDRIGGLVPRERTVVVVGRDHEAIARQPLARYEGVDVAVQPKNLGKGPGLLLPLARILGRDPDARVAIFPSDHHVSRPEPFLAAVRAADLESRSGVSRLVLLGIVPERAEVDYGWILPGAGVRSAVPWLRKVRRFVEKPELRRAEQLLEAGALWNAFVCVGRLGRVWALAHAYLPRQARLLEAYARRVGEDDEGAVLGRVYADMEPANFSREVLERAQGLAVLPVRGVGWSDWGSPPRVLDSLRGTQNHALLLNRIAAAGAGAAGLQGAAAILPAPVDPTRFAKEAHRA